MIKIKYFILLYLFIVNAYCETQKVYFYTLDNSISNYKMLKVNFEEYLSKFGNFEFQAFSDKKSFEEKLKKENAIAVLSSWHYDNISKYYNLEAKLVATKEKNIYTSKVLVGFDSKVSNGIIASCYDEEYTKKVLNNSINENLSLIKVPKEIDALMSVSFNISSFAIVSKDSFELFSKINKTLAKNMIVIEEFNPTYKMLIASKSKQNSFANIFKNMYNSTDGKKILDLLNIDGFVPLEKQHFKKLGGLK